jgi:class 3 adenylate cyclase
LREEQRRKVADPPTGTITFLFTDIEGSTALWEDYPSEMQLALDHHDEILRGTIEARGGYVFKTIGDAYCAAFSTAGRAIEAALAAQRALFAEEGSENRVIRVRMALHTGVAEERDGDYLGPPINRVARLLSAGHGGQILLSDVTYGLVRDSLGRLEPEAELRDLGEHRLKDLRYTERIHQLVVPDLPSDFPALKTHGLAETVDAPSSKTRELVAVRHPSFVPGRGVVRAPHASPPPRNMRTLLLAGAIGILLVLLAGGGAVVFAKFGPGIGPPGRASENPPAGSPEAEVRWAVKGHYEAIGAGNFDEAYSYFGPAYQSIKDEETWISDEKSYGIRSSKINSLEVDEVSGNPATATVDVSFEDNTGTPRFLITWNLIREDGRWKLNEQASAKKIE